MRLYRFAPLAVLLCGDIGARLEVTLECFDLSAQNVSEGLDLGQFLSQRPRMLASGKASLGRSRSEAERRSGMLTFHVTISMRFVKNSLTLKIQCSLDIATGLRQGD